MIAERWAMLSPTERIVVAVGIPLVAVAAIWSIHSSKTKAAATAAAAPVTPPPATSAPQTFFPTGFDLQALLDQLNPQPGPAATPPAAVTPPATVAPPPEASPPTSPPAAPPGRVDFAAVSNQQLFLDGNSLWVDQHNPTATEAYIQEAAKRIQNGQLDPNNPAYVGYSADARHPLEFAQLVKQHITTNVPSAHVNWTW